MTQRPLGKQRGLPRQLDIVRERSSSRRCRPRRSRGEVSPSMPLIGELAAQRGGIADLTALMRYYHAPQLTAAKGRGRLS